MRRRHSARHCKGAAEPDQSTLALISTRDEFIIEALGPRAPVSPQMSTDCPPGWQRWLEFLSSFCFALMENGRYEAHQHRSGMLTQKQTARSGAAASCRINCQCWRRQLHIRVVSHRGRVPSSILLLDVRFSRLFAIRISHCYVFSDCHQKNKWLCKLHPAEGLTPPPIQSRSHGSSTCVPS